MTPSRAGAVLAAIGLAGCASAPEPIPFRGPMPSRVAVLPVGVAPGVPESMADLVASGIPAMLRDRGFDAVPAEVTARVEGAGAAPTPTLLVELVRVFGVDAVLASELRAVSGTTVSGQQELALRWTFLDPSDGSTLWTTEESVTPGQVTARHLGSPGSRFEADPFFRDEPQVGRGGQTWVTEVRARSPEELVEVLLGALAARLPRGPVARTPGRL